MLGCPFSLIIAQQILIFSKEAFTASTVLEISSLLCANETIKIKWCEGRNKNQCKCPKSIQPRYNPNTQ